MRHLRAGAGRVRARRGRAAVGRRGQASTSTSSPGSRSTTPATATRGSSPRSREQAARFGGVSNLFYSEPAMRLCERLAESSLGGRGLPLQLRRRGERVRDQARPQARPRARDRARPRSSSSTAPSTAARSARSRRPRGSPARTSSGRCRAGFVAVAARRPGGAARRGRRAHRGGDDRADPGRGRGLPDRRRGPGRRPRGLRRGRAPCWSSTRSSPGWGGPGRCGPTSSFRCAPTC